MGTTAEQLERRVVKLEQEVARLAQRLQHSPVPAVSTNEPSLLVRAAREKPALQALAAKVFAEMGIATTAPVSPEELRRRMQAEGIRPEENLFSRGVQEMRKE